VAYARRGCPKRKGVMTVDDNQWTTRLSARANRRFWRNWGKWPPKQSELARGAADGADRLARMIDEGTRYLLVGNGALLFATISGIGGVWKEPELRQAFRTAILLFMLGLMASISAWFFGTAASQNVLKLKSDLAEYGYTQPTRKTWRQYRLFGLLCIMNATADGLIVGYALWIIRGLP